MPSRGQCGQALLVRPNDLDELRAVQQLVRKLPAELLPLSTALCKLQLLPEEAFEPASPAASHPSLAAATHVASRRRYVFVWVGPLSSEEEETLAMQLAHTYAQHATRALAYFAADEEYRGQLGAWGALQPLVSQLSPSAQPDPRTRAMALSDRKRHV